ncbi:MAG: CHASE2 domain-containing protein, partial [Paracoccaceae bacterium]
MRLRLPSRERIWVGFRTSRLVGLTLLTVILTVQILQGDDENVPWRHDWWDRLHKMAPRDRGDPADSPVVIVAIDSETMLTNGAWPWPRDKLAELVSQIAALEASVIAFDIILSNPDPQSPVNMAKDYRAYGRLEAAEALERVGDTDAFFAQILRDGYRDDRGNIVVRAAPVVLPITGIPDYTDEVKGQGCDFPRPAVDVPKEGLGLQKGFNAAEPALLDFIQPRPGLQEAAMAAINFNASDDFVVRRVKAVQRMCGAHFLLLGAEALRIGSGQFRSTVTSSDSGHQVVLGSPGDTNALTFPVESNGDFWLHFGELGTAEEVAKRYLPALSLFDPDFDPARIAGKIVLLAVIDLGRIDERKSPLGDTIWGIEAHAQMIEQIAGQDFLRRPWFLFYVETLLVGGLSILVIILVPRAPPVQSLLLLPMGIAGLLFLSWIAFTSGLLIDLASPALAVTIVAGGVIGLTLIERDRERLRSEIELQSERADRSFLQGALDAAARSETERGPPTLF